MGGQEMEKEENEERKLEELVKRLEEAEEKQLVYARRQMICAALAAVSCFLLFCAVTGAFLAVLPRVHRALDSIETAAQDLQSVSDQLSKADLETLVKDVDRMAVTSEEGIREALFKIRASDIEELNQAIQALADVVSPLAKLVNRFQ